MSPPAPASRLVDSVKVAFATPDESRLAVGAGTGLLRVTDLEAAPRFQRDLRHPHAFVAGAFDPTGPRVVTSTTDGRVQLWDLNTGEKLAESTEASAPYSRLTFSQDGRRLGATAVLNNTSQLTRISLLDSRSLSASVLGFTSNSYLSHLELSRDGRYLLTTSVLGLIRIWDSERPSGPPRLLNLDAETAAGHFSPDGRWLATSTVRDGFNPGAARVWSLADLSPVGEIMEHQDGVSINAFSPDGRRLATGSEDSTARIWEVPSGKPATPPLRHRQNVMFLQFSADGSMLATGTRAGVVQLWDTHNGLPLMAGHPLGTRLVSLHFVPGGKEFVVLTSDGMLHRWNLTPATQSVTELEALADLDEDSQDTNRVRLLYGNTNTLKSNFGETTGWNREHSWPNSYGIDSEGPAYSDLHHLFACDANVNSSRGNKFYDRSWAGDGNLVNPAHAEAVGSTADRDSWQPPDDQRGDIARALFYVDVRYAGDTAGELDLELTDDLSLVTSTNRYMGRLTTLLCWHLLDPVDEREQRRNEGVFTLQNNRNPFVDHPEFVALVFGDAGRLNIQVVNGQVELTWPSALEGQLLESEDLLEWQPVGSGIVRGRWTNLLLVGFDRPLKVSRLVWP